MLRSELESLDSQAKVLPMEPSLHVNLEIVLNCGIPQKYLIFVNIQKLSDLQRLLVAYFDQPTGANTHLFCSSKFAFHVFCKFFAFLSHFEEWGKL